MFCRNSEAVNEQSIIIEESSNVLSSSPENLPTLLSKSLEEVYRKVGFMEGLITIDLR